MYTFGKVSVTLLTLSPWSRMNICKSLRHLNAKHSLLVRSLSSSPKSLHDFSTNKCGNWKKVLMEAESVVGYPTSFLSLRWLLNDEAANIALLIRKLIGTDHPLLKTAKSLLTGNATSTWGLVVLLVSKAGGVNSVFTDIEHDHVVGILHSQRVLAEVTEMMRISNILHKGLVNIDSKTEYPADMNLGNTVALLSGDYTLTTSFNELASLRNSELNELMSAALRDLSEIVFIGPRSYQNEPLPSKPVVDSPEMPIPDEFGTDPLDINKLLGNAKSEWTLRNLLDGGSLLAKSCQGTLLLADHTKNVQMLGYIFGKNFALAKQAAFDYEQFRSGETKFSLVSAPVMFHLQYDPEFYSEIEKLINENISIDYEKIKKAVSSGPGLEKTLELKNEFTSKSLDALSKFRDSKAKDALVNLLTSL